MKGEKRIRVEIEGIVQGVGFRPFVFHLAQRHQLAGWVSNTSCGVILEAEGGATELGLFYASLQSQAPPLAQITSINRCNIEPCSSSGFSILPSSHDEGTIQISPDCHVCSDCLRELLDPHDRRYRYPFINCTNCGPRYSIITGTPYDRASTTMSEFAMCEACRVEYDDPGDRRFHAQPNACPNCGPKLALLDQSGNTIGGDPVAEASRLLASGRIIAMKGLGGYHLVVDACNGAAVEELRRRKKRGEKPFALMVADLDGANHIAHVDSVEGLLLTGPERPIVLLRQRDGNPVAVQVAPANGYFGIMLPSTPLQHLLIGDFKALVMTSGNIAEEPVIHRDDDALAQLRTIADYFLVHDRRIHAPSDDSIIRVFNGKPIFLRRSRGYVPRSIRLIHSPKQVLAVGAELKGAVCLIRGNRAFMSRHLGDLKNEATFKSLEDTVSHLETVLSLSPDIVAHDLHPDYQSTTYALGRKPKLLVPVQHHHAHMASCMAENGLEGMVLGVIFDGTGYGQDGSIWGGEFLVGDYLGYKRVGHLSKVAMPGGDMAVKEPWRMALSHCHAAFGVAAFSMPLSFLSDLSLEEKGLLQQMLERNINSPMTSSCGRLFDAVAAVIGVRSKVSYEGQAAIELESLAEKGSSCWNYPHAIVSRDDRLVIDCRLIFAGIIQDLVGGEPKQDMALRFHQTLAAATADVCVKTSKIYGVKRVVLSGGVFQNRLFTEEIHDRLVAKGFQVFTHRLVPPNDGGLALGQAAIAGRSELCA